MVLVVLFVNVPCDESQLPPTLIFDAPEQVTVPAPSVASPMVRPAVVHPLVVEAPSVTVEPPMILEGPPTVRLYMLMANVPLDRLKELVIEELAIMVRVLTS